MDVQEVKLVLTLFLMVPNQLTRVSTGLSNQACFAGF